MIVNVLSQGSIAISDDKTRAFWQLAPLIGWGLALVFTFCVARTPLVDELFGISDPSRTIPLVGHAAAHSISDSNVLDVRFDNYATPGRTTWLVKPKAEGLCLIEFATTHGLESFIVHVSPRLRVVIQETDPEQRLTAKMRTHADIRDALVAAQQRDWAYIDPTEP